MPLSMLARPGQPGPHPARPAVLSFSTLARLTSLACSFSELPLLGVPSCPQPSFLSLLSTPLLPPPSRLPCCLQVTAKVEGDNGKPIIDYFGLDKDSTDTQVL